ncbi:MAG: hypothetical protein EHM23_35655 [Acidobacteria bacterium]|nr:MAG: hypothetical protein EHM23_35655 [Acidobacteriota bacterium]
MKIVLVYRPELIDDTDGDVQPFEGIEILGVANTDDEAHELIQRVKDEHIAEPPTRPWHFHIDSV